MVLWLRGAGRGGLVPEPLPPTSTPRPAFCPCGSAPVTFRISLESNLSAFHEFAARLPPTASVPCRCPLPPAPTPTLLPLPGISFLPFHVAASSAPTPAPLWTRGDKCSDTLCTAVPSVTQSPAPASAFEKVVQKERNSLCTRVLPSLLWAGTRSKQWNCSRIGRPVIRGDCFQTVHSIRKTR